MTSVICVHINQLTDIGMDLITLCDPAHAQDISKRLNAKCHGMTFMVKLLVINVTWSMTLFCV